MKRIALVLVLASVANGIVIPPYGPVDPNLWVLAGITGPWQRNVTNASTNADRISAKTQLHLDHVFDVRDYGATGGLGTVDDAAYIQAAINAAGAAGGGVVYFSPGKYKITKALYVIYGGVYLKGIDPNATVLDGSATTLYPTTGNDPAPDGVWGLIYWDDNGGILNGGGIEGLTIKPSTGNPATVMQKGVYIGDVNDFVLDRCIFINTYNENVFCNFGASSVAGKVWVTRCLFKGHGGAGGGSSLNWNMSQGNQVRGIVANNIFENCDTIGVMASGRSFLVSNNIFRRVEQGAIWIAEGDPFTANGTVVSNNLIVDNGYGGAYPAAYGIRVVGVDKDAASVLVTGNEIKDVHSGWGMQLEGSCVVTNNLIHGRANAAAQFAFDLSVPTNIQDMNTVQFLYGNVVADTNEALKWQFDVITPGNAHAEHNTIWSVNNYWGDVDTGQYAFFVGSGATYDNVHIYGDTCGGRVELQKGTVHALDNPGTYQGHPIYISNVTTSDSDLHVDRLSVRDLNYPGLAGATVSDAAYGSGWSGVTTIAPSKNAVWDKFGNNFRATDALTMAVVGSSSLASNTTGHNLAGLGYGVFVDNVDGYDNVAVGTLALANNTSGGGLVAVGNEALYTSITGFYNTAIGDASLKYTTGARNVAVGAYSGHHLTTGTDNLFLGHYAGHNQTGSNRFVVDNRERSEANDVTQAILYGTFGASAAAQTLRVNAALTVNGDANIPTGKSYGVGGIPGNFWGAAVAKTASYNIPTGTAGNLTFTNTGAGAAETITLQPATVGLRYRFFATVDFDLSVDPNGAETFYDRAAGEPVRLDDKGCSMTIECSEIGKWAITDVYDPNLL
jgi:hypothetical protein